MIAVTGANGYVGGRILAALRADGAEAVALVRRPHEQDGPARHYALDEPLADGVLDGVDTVVHAAWDASVRGGRVAAVNARGSLPLLDAAAARGGRVLLISSLSAFSGARSRYGQAKLALEQEVQRRGGLSVRPGLVFGAAPGGLFGSLAGSASGRGPTPIVGGSERLFVTHDEHLARLVAQLAGEPPQDRPRPRVIFAAHERPTTLRALTGEIAAARGASVRFLPVPTAAVLAVLRLAEAAGLELPYRSDSLVSLVNPAPLDQVADLERPPVSFPPFRGDPRAG
ncbi:MAG TPA: NAD-dependent epimerase/dehydratase family protein [Solirubrobacteraceae bacterium]|nr:NAD-dependent epimerase/dehydratase family protein [Solirubrobacteraceae bacterium]